MGDIKPSEDAIWAIASRGTRVFAAGAHGHFITHPADWTLPSLREHANAVVAVAAISLEGHVVCGDNSGRILLCPASGGWIQLRSPRDGKTAILALSFDEASAIWVAWKDGWVTEAVATPQGDWVWRRKFPLSTGRRAAAAAFDRAGRRLAVAYPDGEVSVVRLPGLQPDPGWARPDVPGLEIRAVAWSPSGLLALSGTETLFVGEPGGRPELIRGEGTSGLVAFLDDDHLVTAEGNEIFDWAVREAGSDVPDPYVQDAITAVAIDPRNPSCTMAGTRRGRLLRYDAQGSITLLSAGDPIKSPVHQLARFSEDWLIAAQTGAYRLAPAGKPIRLGPAPAGNDPYMCWAVAVSFRASLPAW